MLDDFTGHLLDAKYRIDRKLGQGGMGAVYLATHVGTTRPVALKVIAPRLVASEEFVERFRREAEAAGRLRHPNVVNVTDFGFTHGDAGRTAYLVMEYLDGETLRAVLAREPTPPVDFVADVLEQTALAVDEAHRNGIVHRDLKPDNIWLQADGRGGYIVKVLDFGLAKLHDDGPGTRPASVRTSHPAVESGVAVTLTLGSEGPEDLTSPGLTRAGSVLGTPAYMSPEQCRGLGADASSDIYSLGVIAYEMLAGDVPFKGDVLSVIAQHLDVTPPPLVAPRARATADLAEVVARAMAKEPAQRPVSATAFAAAVRARTVTGGQVLRRAVALYSEHFPAILGLSLFGTAPLIAIGVTLLAVIPWIRIGLWEAVLILAAMLVGLCYTYSANRATFALALERLREMPLGRLDATEILRTLATRLGLPASAGRMRLVAKLLPFAARSSRLHLSASVPAQLVERLARREANARSERLYASAAPAFRTVALFGAVSYAVPTALFFLATLGVTQALGLTLATATSVSVAVAICVMGMNVVWLIPPAHIALVMLYYHAREASGDA